MLAWSECGEKRKITVRDFSFAGLEPDLATYTSVVLASNRPHTIAQADAIYDKVPQTNRLISGFQSLILLWEHR